MLSGNVLWNVPQLKPNAAQLQSTTRAGKGVRRTWDATLSPSALLCSVDGILGITGLVSFCANRTPLPPGFFEALIERYGEDGGMAPMPALRQGDRMRMASAPFVDMIGSIEKVGAERRVWILLDLLGTKVRLSASSDDLALVG